MKQWRHKFTEDTEREITRRYIAHESTLALSREYGCGTWTIRAIAGRNGATIFPKGNKYREFSPSEIADATRRWHGGETQASIAKTLGLGQTVLSRMLTEQGVATKGPAKGSRVKSWKGGRTKSGSGYWQVRIQRDDPLSSMAARNGYVLEHRLVMARHLGRALSRDESVHHVNGDILDNRVENLQVRRGKHGKGTAYRCACCGSLDIVAVPLDTEG